MSPRKPGVAVPAPSPLPAIEPVVPVVTAPAVAADPAPAPEPEPATGGEGGAEPQSTPFTQPHAAPLDPSADGEVSPQSAPYTQPHAAEPPADAATDGETPTEGSVSAAITPTEVPNAPLTPPTAPADPEPDPAPTVSEVATKSAATITDRIIDAATGVEPDLETLFEPISPVSSVVRCTRRLMRLTSLGHFGTPTQVLVIAPGTEVSVHAAQALKDKIAAQLEAADPA